MGWPALLWATEPVPWAPTQPPQSGPPQETQVGRPDEGHGGAGRLLAVCGHSPEPAGPGVTAVQGGQTRGPTAPDPPRPGAAAAALPGGAEAPREAGSAGCFGAGGSGSSSRRPAACQDAVTAVPALGTLVPSAAAPCCSALLRRCSRRTFPSAQFPRPLRWFLTGFLLLSLSRIKRQGLSARLHIWFCARARRESVEPGGEISAPGVLDGPRNWPPPPPVPWEPCAPNPRGCPCPSQSCRVSQPLSPPLCSARHRERGTPAKTQGHPDPAVSRLCDTRGGPGFGNTMPGLASRWQWPPLSSGLPRRAGGQRDSAAGCGAPGPRGAALGRARGHGTQGWGATTLVAKGLWSP